jgi:hypothetical protein
MPFDYDTNLNAVVNALKNYNSAGSSPDLSDGLSERINNVNILASDPELNKPRADRLPAIYVMISDKEETPEALGATGVSGTKKRATVRYDIFGIFGKYGGHSPHSELLTDIYKLAKNIEGVFQAEYDLSNTALWCHPVSTEFSPAIDLGEGFAKAVLVNLEAAYFFR